MSVGGSVNDEVLAKDVLLSYFARQQILEATAHIVDQESSQRLDIAQQYHKQFGRIASTCIARLEAVSQQYRAITESVRQNVDSKPTKAASPTTARSQSNARASLSPSRQNGEACTTPRIILSSREFSPPRLSCLVTSTVKLTGAPQHRRKNAVEKKLSLELDERRMLLDDFAAREARRAAAVTRRDAGVLHRALETGERNLEVFVDSAKLVAKEYKEAGPLRRELHRKMDAIEEQQRRHRLEQEAAAYAIRKIDHVVAEEVSETKALFERECARLQDEANRIHYEHTRRTHASEVGLRKTLSSKRGSIDDYQKAYRTALAESLKTAVRHEHDKRLQAEKVVTHAVNVEFPPNPSPSKAFDAAFSSSRKTPSQVSPQSPASRPVSISTSKYAQFCGMRESVVHGVIGTHHEDPMILSTIVGMSPAAWK